jgi:hypothetical protein
VCGTFEYDLPFLFSFIHLFIHSIPSFCCLAAKMGIFIHVFIYPLLTTPLIHPVHVTQRPRSSTTWPSSSLRYRASPAGPWALCSPPLPTAPRQVSEALSVYVCACVCVCACVLCPMSCVASCLLSCLVSCLVTGDELPDCIMVVCGVVM